MAKQNEPAEDAGNIRLRIVNTVEGLREQLKDPKINETSRAAIFPLIADGLMMAGILTTDQAITPISPKVMHQADIWLSHAEPLLEALQED